MRASEFLVCRAASARVLALTPWKTHRVKIPERTSRRQAGRQAGKQAGRQAGWLFDCYSKLHGLKETETVHSKDQ